MSFQFLEAFVEFSAKGMETVLSQANKIQEKIRSASTADVKFTASGVNSVENAVTTVKQKLSTIAQGGDLTRMLATSIGDAFQQAGSQAGGALADGMGFAIGGAVGGAVFAALQTAMGSASALFGEKVKDDLAAAHLKAIAEGYGQKMSDKEEEEAHSQLRGEFTTWNIGHGEVWQALDKLYAANLNLKEAVNLTDELGRVSLLSGKSITSLAESYANMLIRGGKARSVLAFAGTAGIGFERELEKIMNIPEGNEEAFTKALTTRGGANMKDINEALRRYAVRATPSLESEQRSLGGFASMAKDSLIYRATHPSNWLVPMGTEWLFGMGQRYGGQPDLPGGDITAPWRMSPYTAGAQKEYSFTSLSGLAEKMQMEASGGGDVQDQQLAVQKSQLNTLKSIDEKTKSETPAQHFPEAAATGYLPSNHW